MMLSQEKFDDQSGGVELFIGSKLQQRKLAVRFVYAVLLRFEVI
jgi:hypothetical protein